MYFCSQFKTKVQLTEKHIILEDIDPMMLYGAKNTHLMIIKSLFPKLRIVARDNVIKILGDEVQMCVSLRKTLRQCASTSFVSTT